MRDRTNTRCDKDIELHDSFKNDLKVTVEPNLLIVGTFLTKFKYRTSNMVGIYTLKKKLHSYILLKIKRLQLCMLISVFCVSIRIYKYVGSLN